MKGVAGFLANRGADTRMPMPKLEQVIDAMFKEIVQTNSPGGRCSSRGMGIFFLKGVREPNFQLVSARNNVIDFKRAVLLLSRDRPIKRARCLTADEKSGASRDRNAVGDGEACRINPSLEYAGIVIEKIRRN